MKSRRNFVVAILLDAEAKVQDFVKKLEADYKETKAKGGQ